MTPATASVSLDRMTSGSLPDSSECGVCRPNTVNVCAPDVAQLRRQDARIGQRVAIDFARQGIWDVAPGGARVRGYPTG